MSCADIVDLFNPQSFFTAFAFACCLISMLVGAQAKTLFLKGRLPQSVLLLIVLFICVGFVSHYSFQFLDQLIEGF